MQLLAILYFLAIGIPAIVPICLGVWATIGVRQPLRNRLLWAALLSLPISVGALWWVMEIVDDTRWPGNVPVIAGALALAAGGTGIVVGGFWPSSGWIVRGALVALLLAELTASGLVTFVTFLYLGGFH